MYSRLDYSRFVRRGANGQTNIDVVLDSGAENPIDEYLKEIQMSRRGGRFGRQSFRFFGWFQVGDGDLHLERSGLDNGLVLVVIEPD